MLKPNKPVEAPFDPDGYGGGGGGGTRRSPDAAPPSESPSTIPSVVADDAEFRSKFWVQNNLGILTLVFFWSPAQKQLVKQFRTAVAFYASAARDVRALYPDYSLDTETSDDSVYAAVGTVARYLDIPAPPQFPGVAAVSPTLEVHYCRLSDEAEPFSIECHTLFEALSNRTPNAEPLDARDWRAVRERVRNFRNWQRSVKLKETLKALGEKAYETAMEKAVELGLKAASGSPTG